MQVDPIKPTLKAPGAERLKLKCDVLLSNDAFKFNMRHYIKAWFSAHFHLSHDYEVGRSRSTL